MTTPDAPKKQNFLSTNILVWHNLGLGDFNRDYVQHNNEFQIPPDDRDIIDRSDGLNCPIDSSSDEFFEDELSGIPPNYLLAFAVNDQPGSEFSSPNASLEESSVNDELMEYEHEESEFPYYQIKEVAKLPNPMFTRFGVSQLVTVEPKTSLEESLNTSAQNRFSNKHRDIINRGKV